jgi:acyl-CoA synthetase (AMP-forming)/AMP-acid ligase II
VAFLGERRRQVVSASDPGATASSLAELLQARAGDTPDALAFCFLVDGEEEGPHLTYADLDREARAVAAVLGDVAGPGDRALLQYAPGLDFVAAFFGCLYAGVVPVPAYPPRLDRAGQSWQVLSGIAADCRPRAVLTTADLAPLLSGVLPGAKAAAVHCIATDRLDRSRARLWRVRDVDQDSPALLQYTSGSTAAPRGVVVTHRNLLHNQRVIRSAFEHSGPGCGVTWLPPYHDMGLVGGVLQSVFHGASLMMMSPLAFLQKPARWLHALTRYRADTSGGPNFAYDLCVQRVAPEQKAALDLRQWSVAAIGSEPVSPATLERFAAAFAPCGFRREAFYPCYGLAEATLLVTGGAKDAPPVLCTVSAAELEQGRGVAASPGEAGARTLVGCGHAWLDQEVVIVDPDTRARRPDGSVGEIWVSGPSVARGYWDRPEETEQTFRARRSDADAGPYLRTGDLGFVEGGELFVTGRIKEVIVIRGRNHYPQDVEATVQSVHPALRPGCGAAFEIERGGAPALVVVQEIDRPYRGADLTRLAGDVRQAVAERHELQLFDVQFLEYGTIPKTSSGKVQRHRCRSGYEQGTLRRWKGKGP